MKKNTKKTKFDTTRHLVCVFVQCSAYYVFFFLIFLIITEHNLVFYLENKINLTVVYSMHINIHLTP